MAADYVRAQRRNGGFDEEIHFDGDGDGELSEPFSRHGAQVGQRQRAMVLLLNGHLDVAALEEGLGDLRGLNGVSGAGVFGELDGWEEEEFVARRLEAEEGGGRSTARGGCPGARKSVAGVYRTRYVVSGNAGEPGGG